MNKLIEAARAVVKAVDEREMSYVFATSLIDALRQAVEEAGWISVEDRLPEVDAECLIYLASGDIATANYSGWPPRPWDGDNYYESSLATVGYGASEVTHWMPLPDPPEVKP